MKSIKTNCITPVLILTLLLSFSAPFLATAQVKYNEMGELTQKYWRMRADLLNDYMIGVGDGPGESFWGYRNIENKLAFGDNTIKQGLYIGLLAMEYRLLANNNSPTEQTVKELFYALQAINRLDFKAEVFCGSNGVVNGYFIRDDVFESGINGTGTTDPELLLKLNSDPSLTPILSVKSDYQNGISSPFASNQASQDQYAFLFLGLAMAINMVDLNVTYTQSQSSQPEEFMDYETGINEEAVAIMLRLLEYIYDECWEWTLINPVNKLPVPLGSAVNPMSFGFIQSAEQWANLNVPLYCQGSLERLANQSAFYSFIKTWSLFDRKDLKMYLALASIFDDQYALESVLDILINNCNQPGDYDFEHYPIIHALLIPNSIASSNDWQGSYYETWLLNHLSLLNCYSHPFNYLGNYPDYEWSANERIVEPQQRGEVTWSHWMGTFPGIDWMFYYLLYALEFDHNNDFYYPEFNINSYIAVNTTLELDLSSTKVILHPISNFGTIDVNGGSSTDTLFITANCDANYLPIVCQPNSLFDLGSSSVPFNGVVCFESGTGLSLLSGSTLRLFGNATLIFKPGSDLYIGNGAEVQIIGNSKVLLKSEASFCGDPSASIFIPNSTGSFVMEQYVRNTKSPALPPFTACQCTSAPASLAYGQGSLKYFCEDFRAVLPHGNFNPLQPGVTSWNSINQEYLTTTIYIPAGRELQITNSTIGFDSRSQIIIGPGGKLVLDNSTLTYLPGCPLEDRWRGILVQGQDESQQLPANQGVLQMKIGATIKNADIAVFVGHTFPNNLGGPAYNWGGGIVDIDDSHFINNQKDIVMQPFQYFTGSANNPPRQRSLIQNSTFVSDANMFIDPGAMVGKHGSIYLNQINGMRILGNVFENQDYSLDVADRWTGITCINSSVEIAEYCESIISPCTNIQPNQFNNLRNGIDVFNGVAVNKVVEIRNNDFQNTYHAIFLAGTSGAVVTLNDIELPSMAACQLGIPSEGYPPYGIFLFGGNGFKVEENEISVPIGNGPPLFNEARGIIVRNTGVTENEIYNNILNNLFVSNQAECFNSGTSSSAVELGLKYFCNKSQTAEGSFDFWVTESALCPCTYSRGPGISKIGIAQLQQNNIFDPFTSDYKYAPCGNRFSDSHANLNTTATNDFDNGDADVILYAWDNIPGSTGRYEPEKVHKVSAFQRPVSFDICPSKIPGNGGSGSLNQLYLSLATSQIGYNSSHILLDIWQNGGNANLDQEVATTAPWDAYLQFNSLIAESPYLSNDVLIEMINNPVFTSLMVKLIMIANPHGTLSADVMGALESRTPPLPQSYIDEIWSQPEPVTQLTILQGNLAADQHVLSMISHDIKRTYRTDSTNVWANDSLIAFLSRQPELIDKYELALVYLNQSRSGEMDSILTQVGLNFEMDSLMQLDYQHMLDLTRIAQAMRVDSMSEGTLDSTDLALLETILLDDRPLMAPLALSLIKQYDPNYFHLDLVYDMPVSSARLAHPSIGNVNESQNDFQLYPNPAIDYTTIKYRCEDFGLTYQLLDARSSVLRTGTLEIAEGFLVNEVLIDLEGLTSGSYQLLVKKQNEVLWTGKLILIGR
jgi:hypothetical protein